MDTSNAADRRRARRLTAVLALAVLPVLGIAGIVGYYMVSGTPFIDEWHCSEGEAPYFTEQGGSACAHEGSALPRGAKWDPFGNRPFICSSRWGWTEVVSIDRQHDAVAAWSTDCVKDGDPIPDGWRTAD